MTFVNSSDQQNISTDNLVRPAIRSIIVPDQTRWKSDTRVEQKGLHYCPATHNSMATLRTNMVYVRSIYTLPRPRSTQQITDF